MISSPQFLSFPRGKTTLFFLIFFLALPFHTIFPAEKKPRVAIFEFTGGSASSEEKEAVTDQLRSELVNQGKYIVLERSQIKTVLKEMAFQQEGLTNQTQAVKIGRLLNVQYVVMGRLTKLKGAYQVNVQMIAVQTAVIVRSETLIHRGDILGLIGQNITTVAARLSQVGGSKGPKIMSSDISGSSSGKPRWALWTGIGVGALGGAIYMGAISAAGQANTLAVEAQTNNDPALFNEATSMRAKAESDATTGLIMGLSGAGLIVYYMMSSNGEGGTSSLEMPPVMVAGTPGNMRLMFQTRW